MRQECLILGKVNVGKTLFLISFAEYLGLKDIEITFLSPDQQAWKMKYSINRAKGLLINPHPHKTRCLQKVTLNLPMGKGKKEIALIDSSGFVEGIHENREIRKGIAQTLSKISKTSVILHLIDTAKVGEMKNLTKMGEVDLQIAQFAQIKGGYALLANKMDIPYAKAGLDHLKQELSDLTIIPISAKEKQGFKEVKAFVCRNI